MSLSIANQTGVWKQNTESERIITSFDRDQIAKAVEDISWAHHYWANFFGRNGITPLLVTYESLCEHPERQLREIGRFADCELPEELALESDLIRQANQSNADFRDAFLSGNEKFIPTANCVRRVVPRTLRNFKGLLSGKPI